MNKVTVCYVYLASKLRVYSKLGVALLCEVTLFALHKLKTVCMLANDMNVLFVMGLPWVKVICR